MDGQEYRERLLVHAKKRGYTQPSREGNDWIFKAAIGARAIVEFEPFLTEKSGYLTYAKIKLTAIQNEAMGKWPERVAARLRSEYTAEKQQVPSADGEGSRRRVRRPYPKILPQNFALHGEALPGEDRSFGGNGFYIDSIPRNAWFRNLRAMMPPHQWKTLSDYVRRRAGSRCEMCGSNERLEAHERWQFDRISCAQKLVRIMCLCKKCHLGVHMGLASRLGLREEIERHILSFTGWSKEQIYARPALARADRDLARTQVDWRLDVSVIEAAGFTIDHSGTKVAEKEGQLAAERENSSIEIDMGGGKIGRLDLFAEIRAGMAVIACYEDVDCLGGIQLSDPPPYIAKLPKDIRAGLVSIPLRTFVRAHNNPVTIRREKDLDVALQDRDTPRRLIVKSSWIDDDLVIECLKDAILF